MGVPIEVPNEFLITKKLRRMFQRKEKFQKKKNAGEVSKEIPKKIPK